MTTTAPEAVTGRRLAILTVLLGSLTAFGPLSMDLYLPAFPQLAADLGATQAQVQLTLTADVLGLVVGCLLGLLAGYFGGPLDAIINIFATATLAFPALILLFAIVAVFKASIWSIGIGLAFLSVPTYTRLMRAQTISLLQREFVLSARSMKVPSRMKW